ncbi:hypothetical protein [Curtobacterium sp. S6]|uniref:hypothetical protein n=1 Tax=Curtobacterium sp. S6 TaxID=1479623 RepID=UPI00128F462E|nr:hypothetical protein [Curtobacterium sp. S6]
MNNISFSPSRVAGHPFLIIGWREGGETVCRRMTISTRLHKQIREIAETHLASLDSSTEREYEPSAALERDEQYFSVPVSTIPKRATRDGYCEASLLTQLRSVGDMEIANSQELKEKVLLFYAFTFQQDSGSEWLTFIRKVNPTSYFRAGKVWCTVDEGLKKLSKSPTFAFDNIIDLLFDKKVIYASAPVPLKQLFTEVNLSAINVPGYVDEFVLSLPAGIKISEDSANRISKLATAKVSFVSRVHGLSARLAEISQDRELTAESFVNAIDDDETVDRIIQGNEIVLDTDDSVEVFLDAVEGRFFRDGWTSERRRADRYSTRRS